MLKKALLKIKKKKKILNLIIIKNIHYPYIILFILNK